MSHGPVPAASAPDAVEIIPIPALRRVNEIPAPRRRRNLLLTFIDSSGKFRRCCGGRGWTCCG
jgi:hypothetical protein